MTVSDYPSAAGVVWCGEPASFGVGRAGPGIKLSVIHTTEGHADASAAENGCTIDKNRTDGTSTHCFHDNDSSTQEVLRKDTAYSAFEHGNNIGIHHELCGFAEWTGSQWAGSYQEAMLNRCARAVADDCVKYGLQVRRLSVAEVRAAYFSGGKGGICGHVDITNAFPEDPGTHDDPGTSFPWDHFIQLVQGYVSGKKETDVYYFNFGQLHDVPADLGSRVIKTDGIGRYWVVPNSFQYSDPALIGTTVFTVTLGSGKGQLPAGTTFATAFSELTGCTWVPNSKNGLADWLKPAAAPGGGVTLEQVNAQIAGSVLSPPEV